MRREFKGGIITIMAIILIALILLYPQLTAPNEGTQGNHNETEIIISINFGKKVVEMRNITPGYNVIDALEKIANVSTAYNGKFVTGINGINQNRTFFWFYYVNGMLSNIGASSYKIHPGDKIRWDFHRWDQSFIQYAEIADFPEPFLHGFDGKVYNTTIVYEKRYYEYALTLQSYFKKLGVSVKITENVSKEEIQSCNIIIIGDVPSITDTLGSIHDKLGWFYYSRDGFIVDSNNEEYRGAFIEMSQSPFNPKGLNSCENTVTWIYATSDDYMSEAIENLLNGHYHGFWYFNGEKL